VRRLLPLLLSLTVVSCSQSPPPKPAVVPPPVVETTPPPAPEPPRYDDISLASQDRRIPVIMYHDIIAKRGKGSQWFDCTEAEFEAQMKFLQEHGALPISLKDLYDHLTMGKEVPETAVVLTFDDNYQGFHDHALPILRKYSYPAAMFVHTGFVGDTKGLHPKMSWATLKELVKDPLITIGSHTISHPDDITKLPPEQQTKELSESKAKLESELGVPMDFFAYPNGMNDKMTQAMAKEAGYKMAFTIHNGLAEESPNIMAVDRYVHTRMEKAWDDRDHSLRGGALGIYKTPLKDAPVAAREEEIEGMKLALVTGGRPETVTSDSREGVLDFVKRTNAVAGINGTFFAMAAIKSTDNRLVGPCKTPMLPDVIPDEDSTRWPKLLNRPMVMWGPSGLAILPYVPESMHEDLAFKTFMPDVTDVFLGGAWLVHEGTARERDDLTVYASRDVQDARRRAAFGVTMDGQIVLAAAKDSVSSADFAKALATSGVWEAVLLDSGFSTSLVYGQAILASGHSTASTPSRPVPHAIVLQGSLDPLTASLGEAAPEPPKEEETKKPRRRRRRRH